jgi:hypothetical protein
MPSPTKRAPAGRHISREVSPRWGSNRIIALRFYKYFAPLGLKSTNAKCPYFKLKKSKKNAYVGGHFAPPANFDFYGKKKQYLSAFYTLIYRYFILKKLHTNLMTLSESRIDWFYKI